MSSYFKLKVIRLEDLKWKHPLHSGSPDLYVEAELGGTVRRTKEIESRTPSWNESLIFPVSEATKRLSIALKHKSNWSKDVCVGATEIMLHDLLANHDAEVPLGLLSPKRTTLATGRIILRPEVIESTEAVRAIMPRVTGQGTLYQAVRTLLRRLEGFRPIMDALSEIQPFFKIAWSLTSALYDTVQNVFEADGKIVHLVQTMAGAFEFVQDVEKLRDRARFLQKPIDGLLKQTIGCCIFVRQYTSRGFIWRMCNVEAARKIGEFQQSLVSFKSEIDSGVTLHTAFVSSRMAQTADKLSPISSMRSTVQCVCRGPAWRSGTRSLSGCSPNIFWLHGVAGSGKSTVSTTLASHFRQMSRLGAFLFFERGKSEPSTVIRTIAYSLALYDVSIGMKIIFESKTNHDITSAPYMDQFNKLLLHPLASAGSSIPGPVVIVLDALDECGMPESRRGLMALMRNEFPKLPNTFRFLVTSRREVDIDQALSSRSEFVRETALDYNSPDSQRDVISFLHSELNAVRQSTALRSKWPWEENVELLGKASDGLFIWASTAVKMVKDSDNPFYELDTLVSGIKSSQSGISLDELYATVLRNSGIKWEKDRSRDRFVRILSLLLLSKVPLSTAMVDGILGLPPEEPSTLILSRLRSVITYTEGGTIGLVHTSFSDYLVSKRLSDPWCIDLGKARHLIAERCFVVMQNLLHFNICGLESSFLLNDDIQDLADRVRSRIPPHLEYTCLYWSQHLIEVSHSSGLLVMLADFVYHRLLFWFEVLSLTTTFGRIAPTALFEASRWSELQEPNVTSFLRDAKKLASIFATPIIQSAPHIYTSIIPFSEGGSEFATHYSKCVSSMVQVGRVGVKRPPLCLKVFERHVNLVNSVAFSPNGRHVASASDDGTVRLWDVDSGEDILQPLTGRTACFSPDGTRIVSGSNEGQLRVWDTESGNLVLGPLEGHTDSVDSVAWSPDGMTIASSSTEIIIWDAVDGRSTLKLCGHTSSVNSITFSPDSSRLVSGSDDETIRVWSVKSGELAFRPFEGHSGGVNSVVFSPDGKYVASDCDNKAVKIWELESASIVSTLERHTDRVTSVVYLPCGTRVVSGSYKTIKIWDARSGGIVCTLEGHTDWVSSVAVSPDGRRIASSSDDMTVRIWDATTTSNSGTLTKHSDGITSVAFSPDGRHLASASDDESVIVWDARTGEAASRLHGHTKSVTCVAFSSDGLRLISGSGDKTIRIWDTETGESASEPLMHAGLVSCIAVSPDGLTVVSGLDDGAISVWSIGSGRLIAGPLRDHLGQVNSAAFSPNAKRLASGSEDGKIIIWNTDCWEPTHSPLIGHSSFVSSVYFSPDGSQIASGFLDRTIIIWDVESGRKVAGPFEGHTAMIASVIFCLDGRHLISSSRDRTIRVWDTETGQTICQFAGHTGWARSLALSPDGRTIISGSDDNTIRMWDLSDALQSPVENTSIAKTSHSDWVLGDNGWILGGEDRHDLLAWVPPDLRGTLCQPHNTAILSCDFWTKVDFTSASLGERWTECFAAASQE